MHIYSDVQNPKERVQREKGLHREEGGKGKVIHKREAKSNEAVNGIKGKSYRIISYENRKKKKRERERDFD